MQWLTGWLCLIIVTYVRTAETEDTEPPFHPPEEGPPKDELNCRLNARSPLPWLVSVWDTSENMVVGHGSMLTYIAFITTCRQYYKPASAYEAHGQLIWNASLPFKPCMQLRKIKNIFKHPKCEIYDWSFYDISVFKLQKAFEITGIHYPMIALPTSAEMLMADVMYINSLSDTKGCFLVSFRSQVEKIPVFNSDVTMRVIPFQEKCVKLICEKIPADPSLSAKCENHFKPKDNSTMLCVKNKTDANIQLGNGASYWLGGAPLVCNGSTYGIASQPRMRRYYPTEKTDFHYILTFYRVLPWLVMQMKNHSAPWIKTDYIGNKSLVVEGEPDNHTDISPPPEERPTKGTTYPPYHPAQDPASYAVLPTPSIVGTLLCALQPINFLRGIRKLVSFFVNTSSQTFHSTEATINN